MGGAAVLIRVGGTTEAETRERKLRIEDALFATRAAIAEGIVAGGGVALVRAATVLGKARRELPEDEAPGVAIVRRACENRAARSPANAGATSSVVIARVRQRQGRASGTTPPPARWRT